MSGDAHAQLAAEHEALIQFLYLAPVGLVSAISATSTFFVFLFGILLTLFFPKFGREDLSARNLWQKALGGLLIMAGVVLIEAHGVGGGR